MGCVERIDSGARTGGANQEATTRAWEDDVRSDEETGESGIVRHLQAV